MPAGKRTIALRACALLSAATSARAGGAGNAPMVGDDHGSGGGGALSHVFSAKIEMACAGEMMCFIVLFVLVFENLLERVHEKVHHNEAHHAILQKMVNELMIMGFVGFALTIITEFATIDEESLLCFEFAHLITFFVAILYISNGLTMLFFMERTQRNWDRIQTTPVGQVANRHAMHDREKGFSTWLRVKGYFWNHGSTEDMQFKILELSFRREFKVDKKFDFLRYMKFKLESNVQDFIEIHGITWVFVLIGWAVLVVFARWASYETLVYSFTNKTTTTFGGELVGESDKEVHRRLGAAASSSSDALKNMTCCLCTTVGGLLGTCPAPIADSPGKKADGHHRRFLGQSNTSNSSTASSSSSSSSGETLNASSYQNHSSRSHAAPGSNITCRMVNCGEASKLKSISNLVAHKGSHKVVAMFTVEFTLYFSWAVLALQALSLMQSANKIDKFMRLSGAPDSSGLHELLRLLNNVAVKPIGIRDGDEDKGLSLDDEMYDGVGDEDDDEEDGENDEGESQPEMQVASQILKDKEHDSYITNCQLVSLLSSFYIAIYLCNVMHSVPEFVEQNLGEMGALYPWALAACMHLVLVTPFVLNVVFLIPAVAINISLIHGALYLDHKMVARVHHHSDSLVALRNRVRARFMNVSIVRRKPLSPQRTMQILQVTADLCAEIHDVTWNVEHSAHADVHELEGVIEKDSAMSLAAVHAAMLSNTAIDTANSTTLDVLNAIKAEADSGGKGAVTVRSMHDANLRRLAKALNNAEEANCSKMDVVAQVMNIQQSMGMAHDEVLSVQHTARAMELFDVADTSQDGMISFYEMKGLCRKFKCHLSKAEGMKLWRMMKTTASQGNEQEDAAVVSREEWIDFMTSTDKMLLDVITRRERSDLQNDVNTKPHSVFGMMTQLAGSVVGETFDIMKDFTSGAVDVVATTANVGGLVVTGLGSTAMQQTVGKVPGLKIISGALVGDNVEDVDSAGAQQLEELRAHSGDPSAGFSDTDTDLEEENFRNPLSAGGSPSAWVRPRLRTGEAQTSPTRRGVSPKDSARPAIGPDPTSSFQSFALETSFV